MNSFKHFIHEIGVPTVATESISVEPAKIDRIEAPARTKKMFELGLKRADDHAAGAGQAATEKRTEIVVPKLTR
jgi:hypothetical protein